MTNQDNSNASNTGRLIILALVIIFLTVILLSRLFFIQIKPDVDYNKTIDTQSIRIIRVPAIRGQIISSDGIVMADSIPSYDIVFHLAEMKRPGSRRSNVDYILNTAESIAAKIGRSADISRKEIMQQMNLYPAIPITVFSNLNTRELAIASEISPPIPGVEIVSIPQRFYPQGTTACHILGYVGKDDPGEAPDKKQYSYYIPDIKGRAGLESILDTNINLGAGYNGLRGKAGSKLVRVNVKGFVHDDLGVSEPPIDGNVVKLTINWKAQIAAEKVLTGYRGAIVLLNAKTGAVVAMASAPTFDNNSFTNGISTSLWRSLNQGTEKPLLNRALMGEYLPGSIVKPLVGLAGLNAGYTPEDTINCPGSVKIGNSQIRCWAWQYGGHGDENLINAIKDSCNVYFIVMGINTGFDKLTDMYAHAGLGRKTGIELSERSGIFPSKELKLRRDKTSWTTFDTGLISIGQGMIALTPLQAAVYTAAIANGGTIWRPFLIKSVYNSKGKLLFENIPYKNDQLPVTQEKLNAIKEGMHKAVYDDNGSGKRSKNQYIELYGKTGTAQVGPVNNRTKCTWYIGFGYLGKEAYSICVFVEGGAAGGLTNAPIAKNFFETWLGSGVSVEEDESDGSEFIPAD